MEDIAGKLDRVREAVGCRIVGNDETIGHILTCLLAGGHIILESPPGLGKTEMSKAIAESMDMVFKRIQCTPDLTSADIVGESVNGFFVRGPLFSNIVLVDEINRAQPKTQSAFLEAMSEETVTSGCRTHRLPQPFCVIATQNPVEYEGTYRLPEAQEDRFLMKSLMGYLAPHDEREAIGSSMRKEQVESIMKPGDVLALQRHVREDIAAGEDVIDCVISLVGATRGRCEVMVGASTRAAILYARAAKARACLEGRREATVEDVVELAHPILRHRLVMNPDSRNFGYTSDDLIDDLLRKAIGRS
jgi:MoxR-like ATPase